MSLLLVTSGIVTALPLLLFASATRRLSLSLSVVGFMMYIDFKKMILEKQVYQSVMRN